MATDQITKIDEPPIGHGDAPLTGALMARYRRVYEALWRSPYTGGGVVTRDDLDHLSDMLEADYGRAREVGFR